MNSSSTNSKNNTPSSNVKVLFLLIIGMLIAWAVYLAIGSYLSIGTNETRTENQLDPVYDLRKPLLVIGSMGLFLGLWGLAMLSRAKRIRREQHLKQQLEEKENSVVDSE